MSCLLIKVFLIVVGGLQNGVWTEQLIDSKPFLTQKECISYVLNELPLIRCGDRQDGCLKEGESYWCVPKRVVQNETEEVSQ